MIELWINGEGAAWDLVADGSPMLHHTGFRLARLQGGTKGGKSSVAVIAKLDGHVVYLQVTMAEFLSAAGALKAVEEQQLAGDA